VKCAYAAQNAAVERRREDQRDRGEAERAERERTVVVAGDAGREPCADALGGDDRPERSEPTAQRTDAPRSATSSGTSATHAKRV